jgi:flavin-dependent dehydrogenase
MLARSGVAVALEEAGSYPRHKVCGEFITGLTDEVRATLDLESPLRGARRLQDVVWFRGDRRLAQWPLPAWAHGLSRFTLDQRLAEEFVAAGGTLRENQRRSLPSSPAKEDTEGLIQATGRIPATRTRPKWVGLKRHVRGLTLEADLEVHLFPGGYLGLSAIEDHAVNLCGLFPAEIVRGRANWIDLLPSLGLRHLARRLGSAEPVESSSCAVAALDFARDSKDVPWIRLGDSAGMIPPFTGHGMAMALGSAALAVDPLLRYAHGEIDWPHTVATVQRRQKDLFRRRLRVARMLHPLLCQPTSQAILAFLAGHRALPFTPLYHLTHA